ncbi:MAG: type IV toxin-antitoxin system AbiEi family antitoxin domain-containing protein [Oscillospiraceae bacterium]|nr:type IV toxin-antitoxin system AbiEi family antitoxin domain-containing protein [Oscillospiraceae bacterium]
MFTTAQANKVGVSGERLRLLVKSGDLERAHFGTQFGNRPRREI